MATLCCFSSNIRPQYEQDIVDVSAAPTGQVIRFRYEVRYIDDRIRESWTKDQLKKSNALIIYSIQQPQNYHPPAFVPVRHAKVVKTSMEGSIGVVELQLGSYAVLRDPTTTETRGSIVSSFSSELQERLIGHPGETAQGRRFSAVQGEIPDGFLGVGTTEAGDFERLTTYLAGTVSFGSHIFWRVASVRKAGDRAGLPADDDGRRRLESNTTYEVLITYFQPDITARSIGAPGARFDIASDPALVDVIGEKQFEIASRYDSVPIRLRVPALTEVKETVLTIRPNGDTRGPRADLRFLVGPTTGRRLAGGAIAGAAVVLATVPALMSKNATFGDKIWFPILAAALTFALGWWALPVRKA